MANLVALIDQTKDPSEAFSLVSTFTPQQLNELIEYANQKYYLEDTSVLSDAFYDLIVAELAVGGTSPHLPVPVRGKKVELPYHMGSMTKLKQVPTMLTTMMTSSGNLKDESILVSTKLDGVSALYMNGKLYTRGNGKIGQEISFLLPHLSSLPTLTTTPTSSSSPLAVRGELIVTKQMFKTGQFVRPNGIPYENGRNMVSGLVNSLEGRYSVDLARAIHFVAYELIEGTPIQQQRKQEQPQHKQEQQQQMQRSIVEQLAYLKQVGFEVVDHHTIPRLDHTNDDEQQRQLSQIYDQYLTSSQYEIDGIILHSTQSYLRNTSGNPTYAFAYKKDLAILTANSVVVGVEWNVGRTNFIKPVVLIEPVRIDGTTISRVTGYNAKYILDHQIGKGANVTIIRSGGVIPKIIRVNAPATNPSEAHLLPTTTTDRFHFEWNPNRVDLIATSVTSVASSDDSNSINGNNESLIKQITYFFQSMNADGIGQATVEHIFNSLKAQRQRSQQPCQHQQHHRSHLPSLSDFFSLKSSDVAYLGPKLSQMVVNSIQACRNGLTIPKMVAYSGMFDRGIGITKASLIPDSFWQEQVPRVMKECHQQPQQHDDNDQKQTRPQKQTHHHPIYRYILTIKGLGPSAAKSILDGHVQFYQLLKDEFPFLLLVDQPEECCQEEDIIIANQSKKTTITMDSGSTVITGCVVMSDVKGKEKYMKMLQPCQYASNITRETALLVIGNESVQSLKRKKAEERHIPIMTIDQFIDTYFPTHKEEVNKHISR